MKRVFNNKLIITPANIAYSFAAFHGLAYYSVMIILNGILPFDQGIFRLLSNIVFLIPAFFLFLKNGRYTRNKLPSETKWFFIYFIISLFSIFFSESRGIVAKGVAFQIWYVALWGNYLMEFLIVYLLCKSCNLKIIFDSYIKGLSMGGFILAVVFLAYWLVKGQGGYLAPMDEDGNILVLHRNLAALKLSVSLFCSMYLLFKPKSVRNKRHVLTGILFMLPMFLALILTISKTTLIAFTIAFCCYLYMTPGHLNFKMSIISVSIVLTMIASQYVMEPLAKYIDHGTYMTLTERTPLWELVWNEAIEKPIFGNGVATPLPVMRWNKQIGYTGEAHNVYLNAFFQMGIVGLFVVGAMYFTFIRKVFIACKTELLKEDGNLGLAIFILMFASSLTASSPIGFYMPMEFQLLMLSAMTLRKSTVKHCSDKLKPVLKPA